MALSSIWDMWNKWNIQGCVILSLSLQIFLILFAPFRKKIENRLLDFVLWLSYLMADWVVAFGIGLISHNQGNSSTCAAEIDGALQAFWASFLLLHLGGPDTITAFSLEDSSLWQRHLLNLVFQVCAAMYVFVQIFPINNLLMIPTILVFLAGVIKSVERTLALYFSNLPRINEQTQPGRNLQKRVPKKDQIEEMVGELKNEGNKYSDGKEAYLVESIVVKHAYKLFYISKVFLGDFILLNEQRELSRKYFHEVFAMDAFRVISIELQLMYEMLYTKALVIRSKWSYIFRFIAFTNIVMAFVMFDHLKKHRLSKRDVEITYSLLFGGIVLDMIAMFMLISSDWTVARILWWDPRSYKLNSVFHKLISAMDHLRKPRFAPCEAESNVSIAWEVLDTSLIFRRWSESISACNLLSMRFKESPKKIYKRNRGRGIIALSKICSFPLKIIDLVLLVREAIAEACAPENVSGKISNTKFVSKNPFVKELWVFIFDELKHKSMELNSEEKVKEMMEARGDMFLKSKLEGIDHSNLLQSITGLNYDDGIIIWHVATEIWYNKEKQFVRDDKREISKILSDYMLYLLLNQSKVMSVGVGVAQTTSWDILEDIHEHEKGMGEVTSGLEMLCMTLFEPRNYGGFRLAVAIGLVKKLERLGKRKWEMMSGVWVEMLSYAAIHIKGEAHMRLLSKGGELLTFVWLLMAHFGFLYKPAWGIYFHHRTVMFTRSEIDNV